MRTRFLAWVMVATGWALLLGACTTSAATPQPSPTDNLPAINPAAGVSAPLPIDMDDPRFPILPATGDDFVRGRALYNDKCASCHGINGQGQMPNPLAAGQAPPHDDTGHTWHHSDQLNFRTVWFGRNIMGNMPGFQTQMTIDDVILVLAYIKTWWQDDMLARQIEFTQNPTTP